LSPCRSISRPLSIKDKGRENAGQGDDGGNGKESSSQNDDGIPAKRRKFLSLSIKIFEIKGRL
jgi:hypothetical protein